MLILRVNVGGIDTFPSASVVTFKKKDTWMKYCFTETFKSKLEAHSLVPVRFSIFTSFCNKNWKQSEVKSEVKTRKEVEIPLLFHFAIYYIKMK